MVDRNAGKNSFIKGAALLAAAGLLVRVIGALYRIPLAYFIGDEGLGIYTQVYPFYNYLLLFSTAGIPSAIAKMVSEAHVQGEYRTIRRILRVSLTLLFVAGLVASVILFSCSGFIAEKIKDPMVVASLQALSPALFFVALISVLRGYFQGLQNMAPTALSQVVEQLVKLGLGLYLAKELGQYGVMYGTAGALLGVSISELLALIMLIVTYLCKGKRIPREAPESHRVMRRKAIVRHLLQLSIPIMLASSVMALASMVDSLTLQSRLQASGTTVSAARSMIGLLGMANNIVNVTSVLSMALSMSLVPSIARSLNQHEYRSIMSKTATGVKLSITLVMPAAAGLMVLAYPVLSLIYGRTIATGSMPMAVQLLSIAAAGALFLSIVQTTNGILQGMGRVNIPMLSLGAGALAKILINLTLVSNPAVGIYGATIGTVACYAIAAVINIVAVCACTRMKFSFLNMVLKPLGATLAMSGVAYLGYYGASRILSPKIAVLLAIAVAIPAYFLALVALNGLGAEELQYIPGGKKLVAVFRKLRLM
ncbi:MAG: polysaccharide biosynthesis protein [Eubacteriales bacterium]|nr:polysaccharide biosynthesis protein [Eubacteriales bacterium]